MAVVREAVSNAVRHGRPGAVTLTVEAGGELVIDVRDDGVGIGPDQARSGLRNLEQRAVECGGVAVGAPRTGRRHPAGVAGPARLIRPGPAVAGRPARPGSRAERDGW